jgi:hypothetical protein
MTTILLLNQALLNNDKIKDVVGCGQDIDMLAKFSTTGYFSSSAQLGLMPRHGVNNLPFSNHAVESLKIQIPGDLERFNKSWSEITDDRSYDIKKYIAITDKKLVVQWSGGIDSTCVLVAILRNFSKSEREQITVACNWGSVCENPKFYYDHVLPNFQVVDINQFTQDYKKKFNQYIVINGMPADVLLQSVGGLDLGAHFVDPHFLKQPWKQMTDTLISYCSTSFECEQLGQWYYKKLSENIQSTSFPIETCFDFLWWGGFNYHWASQILFEWFANYADGSISWNDHRKSFISWYETDDYQRWSILNNNEEKYGVTLGDFKKAPKRYIYDYDHNEWYFKYKIKMGSAGRNQQNASVLKAFAVTDNFEILYLDRDLERIVGMLPKYLKNI